MFKKFAIFLTPFVLAPFGSLFTPSEAHAQTSYFYGPRPQNCNFSLQSYTPVNVHIESRYSDSAARSVEVSYGYGNNEPIRIVEIWETRSISGQSTQLFPPLTLFSNNTLTYTSPRFNPPREFISNGGIRYIHVRLTSTAGKRCTTQFQF